MTHAEQVERLEFNEANHSYKLDGKRLPSVTTILGIMGKGGLVPWAANMAAQHFHDEVAKLLFEDENGSLFAEFGVGGMEKLSGIHQGAKTAHNRAATDGAYKGSLVHDAIAQYHTDYLDYEPPVDPQAALAMGAFLDWFGGCGLDVIESERMILDAKCRYVGTTDIVLVPKKEYAKPFCIVADVKTNNKSSSSPTGIYPEHLLQLAAYAKAYEDETGMFVKETRVIHCGKDGLHNVLVRKRSEWKADYQQFIGLVSMYEWLRDARKIVKG